MIQLLAGDNNYEIRARRARIIAEFGEGRSQEAVGIVDGTGLDAAELPQLLLGANLFAPERLVVIDDANGVKATWDKMVDYLQDVGEGVYVLLVAPTADKRTRTYKWLQKNAEVITPNKLTESQLNNWIQNYGRNKGIEITTEVARFIADFTGGDQWQLANDIDKLALSGSTPTIDLVRDLLVPNPLSSAFDLLDAALGGRKDRIDQLLGGVRSHEDPYRFFGLLSNQIFAIIIIAAAGNRSADTIAQDSGLHPYVVRKTQPLSHQLNNTARARLAEVAATTDMQLKTSGTDPWVLITAALKNISAR